MDGRQIAASFVLGAQAVVIGTALAVAKESMLPAYKKQAILSAGSQAALPGGLLLWLRLVFTPLQTLVTRNSSILMRSSNDGCDQCARRCNGAVADFRPAWCIWHMAA